MSGAAEISGLEAGLNAGREGSAPPVAGAAASRDACATGAGSASGLPAPRPRPGATGAARVVAAGVGMGCLGVLGVAAWMTPAAAGHGTHGQLGLPPCGWVLAMNRPCPSCGMTTAFAHAADGNLAQAAWAQPAGLILAVLAAAGVWASAEVAVLGSNLSPIAAKLLGRRALVAGAVVLGAAWIFKLATWGG